MTQNPDHQITSDGGAKGAAREEAGRMGSEAQGAARDVAGTAKDEARHVKDEAVGQARDLASSAKQEAASQLSTQKDRLASQSRTVTDDLDRISRGERPESDLVNQAVSMLSQRARRVSEHLETREPMDLLEDVRRFAARRPGAFLAIAAGVGLLAGRLTRGLKDAHDDDGLQGSAYPPARPAGHAGPGPVRIEKVPGTVYPEDLPADGPAGTMGTPGVLGTPAAYGIGVAGPGGRS